MYSYTMFVCTNTHTYIRIRRLYVCSSLSVWCARVIIIIVYHTVYNVRGQLKKKKMIIIPDNK